MLIPNNWKKQRNQINQTFKKSWVQFVRPPQKKPSFYPQPFCKTTFWFVFFWCPKLLVLDPNVRHRHYVVAKSERPGRRYPKWNSHKKMASTQQSSDSNYQLSLYQSESISQCWLCSSATETKRNFHENWKTPTNTTNTQKKPLEAHLFFPGGPFIGNFFFSIAASTRQPSTAWCKSLSSIPS